jgi:ankyrin repeat protein
VTEYRLVTKEVTSAARTDVVRRMHCSTLVSVLCVQVTSAARIDVVRRMHCSTLVSVLCVQVTSAARIDVVRRMHCSTLVSVLCVQACDARERSGSSALFLAAYHGHQDCIRVLVEAGATVQVRGANLEMCTAAVQVWVAGVWVMIVWVMTVQACDR